MKAFVFTRYGGPEAMAMREVKRPSPSDGEVLIQVAAAGLNPVDYKIREGKLRVVTPYHLPAVMGNELAGTVAEIGPEVTRFAPGDRVFARTDKHAMGALAEFAIVPEDALAGLTALQALRDEMNLGPGSRVYIPGGAGGVGTFAIQIAKWLGAFVITSASPRGRALVERLGADEIVDYTAGIPEEQVGQVDAVFDLLGGETLNRSFALVKMGGIVVSIAAVPEPSTARKDLGRGPGLAALFWVASLPLRWRAHRHGVRYRFLLMHPSGSELSELGALIERGVVEPVIDRVFPFDETAAAMAYLEAGRAKGKVVVRVEP